MLAKKQKEQIDAAFIKACKAVLLHDRNTIETYCREESSHLINSLLDTFRQGLKEYESIRREGKKGNLSYIQFSFLISGVYAGENLIKVDFYDERLYEDPYEIDCYFDYQPLLPPMAKQVDAIITQVKKEIVQVMDYDIWDRLPTYRLSQMRMLQDVIRDFVQREEITSFFSFSETSIQILYGVYMGSFRKLCTVEPQQRGQQ